MATGTDSQDTIVAAATAPGRAALAVVRLGGPAARRILADVFRRRGGRAVRDREPALGRFLDRRGELLDEGIALLFAAPRSYTGDDLVEMTVHGSPAVVRELVAHCAQRGARPARPGEFTLRALERGKVDLARAEAVRDLVEAATVEQARVAARQLAGEVGDAIAPLADEAYDLLADLEAGLDFAEEEQHLAETAERIGSRCAALAQRIGALLGAGEAARRVREGARVVLLGPPNAGKSALFNRLVGSDRVIVTPEPGTTRDLVEELVVIEGLPVVLVDAAGVREAPGVAEAEGVRRALAAAERADLVLDVYSLAEMARPDGAPGPGRLRVATHADLPPAAAPAEGSIAVSSVSGEGLERLRGAIATALEAPGNRPLESVALANERHRAAAATAERALRRAATASSAGIGPELVALDVREAVDALGEILGAVGPEELLGRIFSKFCIGK